MVQFVTVSERKARETARRRRAADAVMAELRGFAERCGGHFIVFGSVARQLMSFDSDFDVIIDVPREHELAAVELAEDLCRRHELPADIHLKSQASERLLARIADHAVTLP
ncbi:nucleotidyltransferase domain-containing protein [Bradyrhizobium ontarionense]|uniref:Nucleotidyltransferase domain-containing protein n=1 Tax=Bradyrhizobium ontarionense TaxID=2898149 RepID=A0ABY3R5F5_9BRAD|nr:nucleotidyltransferase domain-containing protein [Bradyrhizobium sp. A19]UFZ02277.1 nucleotidyltransferase domain-containing protein [Bradyrhizobium sp. A19]